MSKNDCLSVDVALRVRDTCLCLHTQRAARAMARIFDEALKPYGLNNGQFSLMMALNRPDAPSIGSVADLLAMDRTTLTAKLKPLQRRRLVVASIDGTDKRSRRLRLTTEGREALAAAVPTWERTHAEIEQGLAGVDPDRLRADLLALSAL